MRLACICMTAHCHPGHCYYFLEDVYPRMQGGRRWLKTPALLQALLPAEEDIRHRQPPNAPAPLAFPEPGNVPPPGAPPAGNMTARSDWLPCV